MPEFFSNLIWQQIREQIETDFKAVTEQVLAAVPSVRVSYQFDFSLQVPFYALAAYRDHNSTREDFLVLVIVMRLHRENNVLRVTVGLDRDDVEDTIGVLPDLPDGLSTQISLPPLSDKSQTEIEELFETPFVASQINEVLQAVRSFVMDKETINAIIQQELCG